MTRSRSFYRRFRAGIFLQATTIALVSIAAGAAIPDNCDHPEKRYGWSCTINPDAKTRVDLWHPYDDEIITTTAFINATRSVAARNIDVQFVITVKSWVKQPGKPYREELTQALLNHDDPLSPEVFLCSSRQQGYWASGGLLSNLTDDLNGWGKWKDENVSLLKSVYNLWAPEKVWYTVPINTDSMILIYNRAAFARKNITVPFKMTWKDLYRLAREVNDTATGKWGIGLWESNSFSSRILFPLVFNATQGTVLKASEDKDKTECGFDTPANIEAIREFMKMWEDNVAMPVVQPCNGGVDLSINDVTVSEGGVAMMIIQPLQYSSLKDPSTLGVSAITRSFLGGNGLSISSHALAGTRQAAWDIIKTIVDPDNGYLSTIATSTLCPPPIYAQGAVLQKTSPWNQKESAFDASLTGVVSGVDYGYPDYLSPYVFKISNATLFRCMVASMVDKTKTVEEAVREFCDKVDDIIENFCPPGRVCDRPKGGSPRRLTIILATIVPATVISIVLAVFIILYLKRFRSSRFHPVPKHIPVKSLRRGSAAQLKISGLQVFTLKELRDATHNFSPRNLVGKGGFGEVYRGVLPGGMDVAIKKLREVSEEHHQEFLTEIKIISTVHHKNLVNLEGYCMENDDMMLVYEFMENGSLEDAIFGRNRRDFTWEQSSQILMETAEAIAYLHTACKQRIIHRDIKPANILLDSNLKVRVSDFGLAKEKSGDTSQASESTRIMGTLGYLDPSYSATGQLTEKSDVYSFGMVMLVVLMGRKPLDLEDLAIRSIGEPQVGPKLLHVRDDGGVQVVLGQWVQFMGEASVWKVAARFSSDADFDEEHARRCILIAILCLQQHPETRPTMPHVVQMLRGEMLIPRLPLMEMKDIIVPDYSRPSRDNLDNVLSPSSPTQHPSPLLSPSSEIFSQEYTVSPR